MKKKTRIARTACLSMALLMALSSFSWAESSITKEETVYVNLSHEGKVENIIVSDWLHSEELNAEFYDVSTLDDIKNVKGEEKPIAEGNTLKWKTDKGEIYYQGNTKKDLPLEFDLEYKLNGEKISPELLAGESGKLEIRMEITNKDSHEELLSSGRKTLYTPFAVATVFNFPTDNCRNITVNTGKVVNDGNTSIVTYASVPGLEESLDIDDEDFDDMFDLPKELILKADVYDFEMGDILITAISDASILNDIEGFDDIIDETEDGVEDLSDASEEVQSGIETLSDGTGELLSKFGEFNDGMFSLKDSMSIMEDSINDKILEGSIELTSGVDEFKEKTEELKDGTEELKDGTEELNDGIREAFSGASELKWGSSKLADNLELMATQVAGSSLDTDEVKTAVEKAVEKAVEGAVAAAIANDATLTKSQKDNLEATATAAGSQAGDATGQAIKDSLDAKLVPLMTKLGGGLNQLLLGAQALEGGLKDLTNGMKALVNGSDDLKDGMETLNDNAELFQTGASDLAYGANELTDGLEALGEGAVGMKEGIEGLADASKTANGGIDSLQKGAEDLYEGYGTFSDEGVEELHDKVMEKTKEYDELFEIKESLVELSDRYDNFSGIGENTEGKLKFVIKIDGIEEEAVVEEAPTVEKEKTGFIAWIKNTWNKIFKK